MPVELDLSKLKVLESTDGSLSIEDFGPRSEAGVRALQEKFTGKKLFYYQRPGEKIEMGAIYSILYFSPRAEFYLRSFDLDPAFRLTAGMTPQLSTEVLELANDHNRNGIIFPPAMLGQYRANSHLVQQAGFSLSVHHGEKLIAHISAIPKKETLWNTSENHFMILRFIVHEDYRQVGGVKEFLFSEFFKFLPKDSSLSFQVFPHNIRAQKFFSRRTNVVPSYEKWAL